MIIFVFGLCISCAESQMSHTETTKLVAESFVTKDNESLKKYTTPGRYSSLVSIQNMVTSSYSGETDIRIIQDTVYEDTAWVKFTTAHEQRPETFKLIRENGKWVVTETGIREKAPF